MSGGIIQLIARGDLEDAYFSGEPQASFFRAAFRRFTNFAIESLQLQFDGGASLGRRAVCTLPRSGDLVNKMYLRITLPEVTVQPGYAFRWLNYVGLVMVSAIEFHVGGTRVDRHTGEWLYLWNQLTQTPGKFLGYAHMVGNLPALTNPTYNDTTSPVTIPSETVYVPLEFYFNRDSGHALPLLRLHYHTPRIHVEFRELSECMWSARRQADGAWAYDPAVLGTGVVLAQDVSIDLFGDYIYLDNEERRVLAALDELDLVVTQVQMQEYDALASNRNHRMELKFHNACKELVFLSQRDDYTAESYNLPESARPGGRQWFNYTDAIDKTYLEDYNFASGIPETDDDPVSYVSELSLAPGGASSATVKVSFGDGKNPFDRVSLKVNGIDRLSEREGKYYNMMMPYQYHTNVPPAGVCVMSFAMQPETNAPSGYLNMSRVDSVALHFTLSSNAATAVNHVRVYAPTLNILRTSNGMGTLLYSTAI